MPKKIVTRFAPSPTGFLHVGSLRTALYNFLFAKANKGDFLLRIEDTDQSRKVKGAQESLLKSLSQFKLNWDNKKIIVQSERLKVYQAAAEKLVKDKKAYYCFCSKDRLDNLRKVQQQKGLPPMYDGLCANLDKNEINKTKNHVVRFSMPNTGLTKFTDLIRNKVIFDNKLLDDPVILKSDGFPTYHLASVVDDHEMNISHVIRGEEWLPSTPKHILLHQALGFKPPEFAHLPLLLNTDRSKLSKRQGDVSVEDFLKQGYLEDALLNFVLLLGWNPGTDQEIFNLKEMINSFDLKKVHKGGAIFNTQKLGWLNGEYIRQKSLPELAKLCQPFFTAAGIKTDLKQLEKVVATEQQRIKKLTDIVETTEFFFTTPKYEAKLLVWKNGTITDATGNLKELAQFLTGLSEARWNQQDLEAEIKKLITQKKVGVGDMLWPMRVALTGRKNSPGPFEVAEALGKKESLVRIKKAVNL